MPARRRHDSLRSDDRRTAATTPRTFSRRSPPRLTVSSFVRARRPAWRSATSAAMLPSRRPLSRARGLDESPLMRPSTSSSGVSFAGRETGAPVVGSPSSRARSRSAARSCRRTARAGCRDAGSGTSPCRVVWIQLPSGLSAGRSGPNVMSSSRLRSRSPPGPGRLASRPRERCGVWSIERVSMS